MCPRSLRRQRGFLMPLALFIVIGLGALALAISRFSAGSLSSAVQETLSVQALYAAESGAQYAMNKLLYNVTSRPAADANCISISGDILALTESSLASCQVLLTCERITSAGGGVRVYKVSSAAQCGGGQLLAQRRIEVAALFE